MTQVSEAEELDEVMCNDLAEKIMGWVKLELAMTDESGRHLTAWFDMRSAPERLKDPGVTMAEFYDDEGGVVPRPSQAMYFCPHKQFFFTQMLIDKLRQRHLFLFVNDTGTKEYRAVFFDQKDTCRWVDFIMFPTDDRWSWDESLLRAICRAAWYTIPQEQRSA